MTRMRAIEIVRPGGPETLRLTERRVPLAGEGELLIKVEAAGINRADVVQRKGAYPPPPGASDLPGLEVAGTVVGVGTHVSRALGERVCALLTGGGYAEYVAAPAVQCLAVPSEMDMISAAALPEAFFTVWSTVFMRARLAHHESLLVHGGSSGIGTIAVQLAKALGNT